MVVLDFAGVAWWTFLATSVVTLIFVAIVLVRGLRASSTLDEALRTVATPFFFMLVVGHCATGALWFASDPNFIAAVYALVWLAAGVAGIVELVRRRRRD